METKPNEKRQALRFSLWSDGRTTLGQPVTMETYEELINEIVRADQLGFHGLWVSEHHGFQDGYLPAPFLFLAHVAALTKHLRLGTNILLLPLWPIRLLAEETAVLDLLDAGRTTLGLGLGYIPHEFAAFGVPLRHRRKRMEAGITYLRAAFRGEPIPDGLKGVHLVVAPQPAQGARLPIYLGANSEPAIERVARLADGFLAAAFPAVDFKQELKERGNILKSYLQKYSRDPSTFPIVLSMHLWASDDPERDWNTMLARAIAYQLDVYAQLSVPPGQPLPPKIDPSSLDRSRFLVDTPDNLVKRLQAIQSEVPISEMCFWSHPPGVPHDAVVGNLERIARQVMIAFR